MSKNNRDFGYQNPHDEQVGFQVKCDLQNFMSCSMDA